MTHHKSEIEKIKMNSISYSCNKNAGSCHINWSIKRLKLKKEKWIQFLNSKCTKCNIFMVHSLKCIYLFYICTTLCLFMGLIWIASHSFLHTTIYVTGVLTTLYITTSEILLQYVTFPSIYTWKYRRYTGKPLQLVL